MPRGQRNVTSFSGLLMGASEVQVALDDESPASGSSSSEAAAVELLFFF